MTIPDRQELDQRFNYHVPGQQSIQQAHETVRQAMKTAASVVCDLVPPGRERSLAITELESAMMWANAGIARHQQQAGELAIANFARATRPDGDEG